MSDVKRTECYQNHPPTFFHIQTQISLDQDSLWFHHRLDPTRIDVLGVPAGDNAQEGIQRGKDTVRHRAGQPYPLALDGIQ